MHIPDTSCNMLTSTFNEISCDQIQLYEGENIMGTLLFLKIISNLFCLNHTTNQI